MTHDRDRVAWGAGALSERRRAELAAERAAVETARRRALWVLAACLAGLAAAVWGLVR